MAYGRIYSNDGAMTPGVTQETVDGMSLGSHQKHRWVARVRGEQPMSAVLASTPGPSGKSTCAPGRWMPGAGWAPSQARRRTAGPAPRRRHRRPAGDPHPGPGAGLRPGGAVRDGVLVPVAGRDRAALPGQLAAHARVVHDILHDQMSSPALLAWLFDERYGFGSPWGVT
jgi:hypothetical protein